MYPEAPLQALLWTPGRRPLLSAAPSSRTKERESSAQTEAPLLSPAPRYTPTIRQAFPIRGRCSADISDSDISANILSGIVIAGGSEVRLTRCKVHDGRSNGIQISDASRCTAETCEVASNGFAGVRVSQGGYLKAAGCNLHGGKRNAAVIQDNSSAEFTDCDVHGNGQVGILVEEGGKADLVECRLHDSPEGGIRYCGGGTMERCYWLSNNGKSAIEAYTGGSPTIRDCRLQSNEMPGILIHGGSEAVIEHCEILNNSLSGIAVGESSKALITECTIRSGGQVGLKSSGITHGEWWTAAESLRMRWTESGSFRRPNQLSADDATMPTSKMRCTSPGQARWRGERLRFDRQCGRAGIL